jgi:hypothetical protein
MNRAKRPAKAAIPIPTDGLKASPGLLVLFAVPAVDVLEAPPFATEAVAVEPPMIVELEEPPSGVLPGRLLVAWAARAL